MIAEGDPDALRTVIYLLRNRQAYAGMSPNRVATWAVKHLRVLSGMSLEELGSSLGGFWAPPDEETKTAAESDADLEPLAKEIDFWLRWWDRRGSPTENRG